MDMSKFSISANILGAKLICDEIEITREASVVFIPTAANGVISRKQGVKKRIMTLKGKAVSGDFDTLQSALEQGLYEKTTVTVNTTQYENAEIYDYSIKLKAGEKLAEVSAKLYLDNE